MPRCSDAQVDGLHRNLVVADVSLGIGLAALAASVVTWIARPSVAVDAERPAISVVPTRTGASFSATLNF